MSRHCMVKLMKFATMLGSSMLHDVSFKELKKGIFRDFEICFTGKSRGYQKVTN